MECSDNNELITVIPEMFDALMGNLWGDGDDILRDNRIEQAWENYSELERNENNYITKEAIENTVINAFLRKGIFNLGLCGIINHSRHSHVYSWNS